MSYIKKISIIILLSVLAIVYCGCQQGGAQEESKKTIQKVEVAEFQNIMDQLKNFQLIDVRTPEEYQETHIESAVNINFYDDDFKVQLEELNKEEPILVYCKLGGRSSKAVKLMSDIGFSEIIELKGGMDAWTARNANKK